MSGTPILILPAWRLFGRRGDPPHRRHTIAECTLKNEYGVELRVTLSANWPRTKWWVSAVYVAHSMRASGTLSTTSAKRAAEWESAVQTGQVKIAKS